MPSALAGRTAVLQEDTMELTTQTWTVELLLHDLHRS